MNVVILLGPPGAGKGTVSEILVDKRYKHVSTGDLLREQIRQETPLGIEAKKLMDDGRFVRDDVVVGMIRDLLKDSEFGTHYLFDGFPRTLNQAENLAEILGSLGGTLEKVLLLECPVETIVERLIGRRTCGKCGSVYHVTFNPPAHKDVCDVEGCDLTQRADDSEVTVRNRLEVYAEQTAPLISYYKAEGLIQPINANQPISDVRADVIRALG